MSELTGRLSIPFPSEGERPFYNSYRAQMNAVDALHFAHAENKNIVITGGGLFAFNATTGVLSWASDIILRGFVSGYGVTISGPSSVTLNDGQLAYIVMPRLLQANAGATPVVVTTLPTNGTSLADLIILGARIGAEVFFPNGNSLLDGQSKNIFSGGYGSGSGHTHVLEKFDAAGGETSFFLSTVAPTLLDVRWYKAGQLQFPGDDYSVDLGTGEVTLLGPAALVSERYVADKIVAV